MIPTATKRRSQWYRKSHDLTPRFPQLWLQLLLGHASPAKANFDVRARLDKARCMRPKPEEDDARDASQVRTPGHGSNGLRMTSRFQLKHLATGCDRTKGDEVRFAREGCPYVTTRRRFSGPFTLCRCAFTIGFFLLLSQNCQRPSSNEPPAQAYVKQAGDPLVEADGKPTQQQHPDNPSHGFHDGQEGSSGPILPHLGVSFDCPPFLWPQGKPKEHYLSDNQHLVLKLSITITMSI